MRYIPRLLKDNVNVSKTPALREFFVLLGGLLAVIVGIYVVLGFAVDFIVSRLPLEVEQTLEKIYSKFYENIPQDTEPAIKLQSLLDELLKELPEQGLDYKVHIVSNSKANALALPGGHIVVFSALLDEVSSENELSMILAHELGHFANRDHLRGLGRQIVLLTISITVLGADNPATNFLKGSLVNVQMKYSQHQERQADLFAVELLNKRYGHVAGAVDFFNRLKEKEKMSRFLYFFAMHPPHRERIITIKKYIQKNGYIENEKTPLILGGL